MKVTVKGQDYPLPENFTFREMNTVHRITGLRAGQLYTELMAGNSDVAFAFALIAMRRAGDDTPEQDLFDMDIEDVVLDLRDEEDESRPPEAAPDDADAAAGGSTEPSS
jgi:hypothetical protein